MFSLMKLVTATQTTRLIVRSSAFVLLLAFAGCGDQGGKAEAQSEQEHPGEAIYVQYCASCHNAGVAEAPVLGDKEQWSWRLNKSEEELLQRTIEGIPPGMPKKGLCLSCTDEQLKDAIDYMVEAVN